MSDITLDYDKNLVLQSWLGTNHSVRIYLSLKASTSLDPEEKSKDNETVTGGDYSFLPDVLFIVSLLTVIYLDKYHVPCSVTSPCNGVTSHRIDPHISYIFTACTVCNANEKEETKMNVETKKTPRKDLTKTPTKDLPKTPTKVLPKILPSLGNFQGGTHFHFLTALSH